MTINVSSITSILNQLQTSATTTTQNDYSTQFADYLSEALSTSSSSNAIDASSIASYLQQAVNGTTSTDITSLLNSGNTNSSSIEALLSSSSATSSSTDSALASLYRLLDSSSTTNTTNSSFDSLLTTNSSTSLEALLNGSSTSTSSSSLMSGFESAFKSAQMKNMQAAYAKLQSNLDDFKNRNADVATDAVQSRIKEMTQNVQTVQNYIQSNLISGNETSTK